MMTLGQAAAWIPGARQVGDDGVTLSRVHTDTRTLTAGDLFVAVRGERFDAHDFLARAQAQGAVAALAEHGLEAAGLAGLEVDDSRLALGQLAAGWRSQFSLPLIAITGSNGKTTVTQMVASILRAWKGEQAFATQGNLNNDIGVPMTLLRLQAAHAAGVVELGMNHPGEIAYLANLVRPTVALVNNAQREHLEFMATIDAVAQENGSVLTALPSTGIAVFPADDDYTATWRSLAGSRKVLTFALEGPADVTATAQWHVDAWQVLATTPDGAAEFSLSVAGRHNVKNALAAVACALAAGAPLTAVAAGLTAFVPVKGRSRAVSVLRDGRTLSLVDDTYNANPDSMRAAIEMLASLRAPRLLVMGDMGEVGQQGAEFHAEAGTLAAESGIDLLYTLGDLSAHAHAAFAAAGGACTHFSSAPSLISAVMDELPRISSVLVKGSRFMKMEQVIHAIEQPVDAKKLHDTPYKAPHAA